MTIKSGDRIAVKIANWSGRGWGLVKERRLKCRHTVLIMK